MGRTELQPGKAVQRPLENQMRERNRDFERITDDVGQQAVALEPFLEIRDPLGMEKNQPAKFLRLGPESELSVGPQVTSGSIAQEARGILLSCASILLTPVVV